MKRTVVLSALVAVVALECLWAVVAHRGEAELRDLLESGEPRERVEALFVLTNRGIPEVPDRDFVGGLLGADDAFVQEWTMTTNFARFDEPRPQQAYLASLGRTPHAFRCQFLLRHRVGLRRNITLAALARFLARMPDDER